MRDDVAAGVRLIGAEHEHEEVAVGDLADSTLLWSRAPSVKVTSPETYAFNDAGNDENAPTSSHVRSARISRAAPDQWRRSRRELCMRSRAACRPDDDDDRTTIANVAMRCMLRIVE